MSSSETENRGPRTETSKVQRRGDDIARRLVAFAVAALRLAGRLPKSFAGRHIAAQLIRSATSAGANYEEARGGESRADFVHKLGVSRKEIREASYWVELVCEAELLAFRPQALLDEARELSAILGASTKTAQQHT